MKGRATMTGGRRLAHSWIAAMTCCATLSACTAFAQEQPTQPSASQAPAAAAEVVLYALGFLGVPYRWGGDDPQRGFDCSGFVRHVYRGVPGLELPRTSEAMSRNGRRVERAALAAGDLVFFNTLGRPWSHVGIYLGEGRFVHAPARRGQVRIEGLDDAYWRARYNGARRLIDDTGRSPEVARMPPPSNATSPRASAPPLPAVTATEEALANGRPVRTGPLGEGP